ncbi:hypothetical protein N0V93_000253 [Gnomoniopsis smithogilvyi]|uniref:Rhodopsin domain-containing protein n=1 Tax=Gnomoniopsis smithogilvyi TaxID=1191159 RepID=A0A9W8YZG9_9PEZI|nr:hypothetical protein N0V93_000253 [Gnomoniopsis smithogilvyi]
MAEDALSMGSVPDRGLAVFAVTVTTLVVGTFFFVARIVCRTLIVRRVSWDDYFMIIAWFLAVGLTTTIDVGTRFGLGKFDVDIPDEDRLPLRKTEYVFSVLYNPALMALKTSILVFYLRLSKNTQQVLRVASWVVLGIVNIAGIVLTLLNIFQCRPVQAAFSLDSGHTQCIPLLTEFICSAPVNIVTDLAILALPIPVLTGMRLPKRQKYILVFTFSLGVFVTIVDVVRIYYLQQAITTMPSTATSSDPSAIFGDSPDFAWNASLSLMWSAVEVNVGMICACIPTLKPLIIKILPSAIIDPNGTQNSNISTYATESEEKDNGPSLSSANDPLSARNEDDVDVSGDKTGRGALLWLCEYEETQEHDQGLTFRVVAVLHYCHRAILVMGFSYGLLNTLNNVIASIANMNSAETIGLTSVYFGGGYFFGPLVVGEWVLRHDEHARFHHRRHKHRDPVGGFKATFIMGLCIYGIGTIMFWPSAVLTSFPGFLISNFVVGFGLAVLETAANPFIILCGPSQYAETRILISQGVQGVATVISGLLAEKVFFVDLNSGGRPTSKELLDVQWTYLAITLLSVALALFFYYMPLPEVRDAELGHAAERLPVDPKKRSLGGVQLRTVLIILAVLAQWTYVSAQESMSIFFKNLITAFLPSSSDRSSDDPTGLFLPVTDYTLIAHAAFALSRFNAAHLTWLSVKYPHSRLIPCPRTMLTIFSALSILFALLCVVLQPYDSPNLIVIPAILFFFAEGPIWPLIFAMGLRGQGDRTKRASAWLTMGASGPAIWPFVMYGISNSASTHSLQLAFIVVVVLLLFTLAYPLILTAMRDARGVVDVVVGGFLVGGAGGGMGSGMSMRDPSVSADDVVRQRQRQLRARRGSVGTTASSGGGGMMLRLADRVREMGKKKSGGRKGSTGGSTTASGSPRFEHRETRRDSDGVRSPETVGHGAVRTPDMIPEEQ